VSRSSQREPFQLILMIGSIKSKRDCGKDGLTRRVNPTGSVLALALLDPKLVSYRVGPSTIWTPEIMSRSSQRMSFNYLEWAHPNPLTQGSIESGRGCVGKGLCFAGSLMIRFLPSGAVDNLNALEIMSRSSPRECCFNSFELLDRLYRDLVASG